MNLDRALRHLARIGITAAVLRAGGVDPGSPKAVQTEVEILLRSALAEQSIVDMRCLAELQMALSDLLTDEERRNGDVLARALRADLVDTGVVVSAAPSPVFEACLAEV